MEKDILRLDGGWEFKEFPETARRMRDIDHTGWMEATVPASIYTCLAEAGVIDAADLTANPEHFDWVSDKSWIFRKHFDVPPSLRETDRHHLVFDGLDTVCQIWLNDKLLGKPDNMFIPHTFDVTGRLKPSGNVLMVKFVPALQAGDQRMQRYGVLSEHHFGDVRRSYIRKAQYQFGSVMGPSLPGCGIFRPVRLEGFRTACIEHLHVRTVDCNQHFADVRVALDLQRIRPHGTALHATIRITGGGLDMIQPLSFAPEQTHHATLLHIERPILWWPRGYGVPHQYHLTADLYEQDRHLDAVEIDFGIRSIRVKREPDKPGTSFQFVVNEQPIQVKGATWVPMSMLPGRCTDGDYEGLLRQAAAANLNMLRVWAGGYYEDPAFYRWCDRLGILVWQDFMFAAAYYPDRRWFTGQAGREIETVVGRLRNHACLALWCGNSRIDSLHESGRLGTGRKFYGKAIYHELIPSILSELDPDREYIPTTPFSEDASDHNEPHSGPVHSWTVWNQYGDRSAYEPPAGQCPRFVAEFGLQSLPDMRTLSLFGPPAELAAGSFSLDKHDYQPGGRQRMARYIADDFHPAGDLERYLWQSQVTQARAVKQYVETLRFHAERNSGCLVWTFNEPAPAIGFSMVDALTHPKAVYYYAKRFFAPILVTLHPSRASGGPRFFGVVNDSPHRITATLEAVLSDFAGGVLDRTRVPVTRSPFSGTAAFAVPKSFAKAIEPRSTVLTLRLFTEQKVLAENVYFFKADKHLRFCPGDVRLEITPKGPGGWTMRLLADTVMRDVQVLLPQPGRLSDDFFTLLPGTAKAIEIEFDTPVPVHTPVHLLWAGCMRPVV